jgi:transcriptional regulator GlxA family with amidase domain
MLLNRFFLKRGRLSSPRQDALSGLRALVNSVARPNVAEIAKDVGLSSRQLERKCLEYFGVSPVMLARISRFQRALKSASANNGNSLLWVAHALDYYDQMHMVRDFHAFAGGLPSGHLRALPRTTSSISSVHDNNVRAARIYRYRVN